MTISNIIDVLEKQFPGLNLEVNNNLEFGTLSSKIAFKVKEEGKNPNAIAVEFVDKINEFIASSNLPINASNKGPFINIIFNNDFWNGFVENGVKVLIDNQFNVQKSKEKIVLEYVSTNMAKPLHAGHLLQGNYGESLKRILSLKYPNLITNCFLGDWGVNLGTLIWGYKQILGKTVEFEFNGQKITLNLSSTPDINEQVQTYVWANQQKEIVENFDELVRLEHLKLENGDTENLDIWEKIRISTLESTKDILKLIKVTDFDLYEGEQSALLTVHKLLEYFNQNSIGNIENKGRYIQFDEITDWENIPEYCQKNLKQLGRAYLLESKTGYTTYILRDIAAKINYIIKHGIDKQFLFVGNEQMHNFYQVFAICDYISHKKSFIDTFGIETANKLRFDNFKPIFNGMVFLPTGKMSTRKGNFLTATQIIEKISEKAKEILSEKTKNEDQEKVNIIANSALKWFNLNKEIATDTVLDINEILNFTGNTGVYQMYTYSRLNSILENFTKANNKFDASKLNEQEIKILQKLSLSEIIIKNTVNNHKIHNLTNYLFELCQLINSWYNSNSVLYEKDLERQASMIYMISKSKDMLDYMLKLLGIETVPKL